MTTTFKWAAPEATAQALTTELNSLANGAYSAASAEINNETGLYQFIGVELYLASLTPTGTPSCSLYLVPSLDGTNYGDGGGSTAPSAGYLIASFDFSTAAAAKRVERANIPIPPLKFKLVLLNGAGPSLAASGNIVSYRRYNAQGV